ncbi:hypothetical protein HK102_003160 [Quaeritorhiza haematococci]|nr:hypothetical protein HK102_003160 [Quaeritorhiza haematococci]
MTNPYAIDNAAAAASAAEPSSMTDFDPSGLDAGDQQAMRKKLEEWKRRKAAERGGKPARIPPKVSVPPPKPKMTSVKAPVPPTTKQTSAATTVGTARHAQPTIAQNHPPQPASQQQQSASAAQKKPRSVETASTTVQGSSNSTTMKASGPALNKSYRSATASSTSRSNFVTGSGTSTKTNPPASVKADSSGTSHQSAGLKQPKAPVPQSSASLSKAAAKAERPTTSSTGTKTLSRKPSIPRLVRSSAATTNKPAASSTSNNTNSNTTTYARLAPAPAHMYISAETLAATMGTQSTDSKYSWLAGAAAAATVPSEQPQSSSNSTVTSKSTTPTKIPQLSIESARKSTAQLSKKFKSMNDLRSAFSPAAASTESVDPPVTAAAAENGLNLPKEPLSLARPSTHEVRHVHTQTCLSLLDDLVRQMMCERLSEMQSELDQKMEELEAERQRLTDRNTTLNSTMNSNRHDHTVHSAYSAEAHEIIETMEEYAAPPASSALSALDRRRRRQSGKILPSPMVREEAVASPASSASSALDRRGRRKSGKVLPSPVDTDDFAESPASSASSALDRRARRKSGKVLPSPIVADDTDESNIPTSSNDMDGDELPKSESRINGVDEMDAEMSQMMNEETVMEVEQSSENAEKDPAEADEDMFPNAPAAADQDMFPSASAPADEDMFPVSVRDPVGTEEREMVAEENFLERVEQDRLFVGEQIRDSPFIFFMSQPIHLRVVDPNNGSLLSEEVVRVPPVNMVWLDDANAAAERGDKDLARCIFRMLAADYPNERHPVTPRPSYTQENKHPITSITFFNKGKLHLYSRVPFCRCVRFWTFWAEWEERWGDYAGVVAVYEEAERMFVDQEAADSLHKQLKLFLIRVNDMIDLEAPIVDDESPSIPQIPVTVPDPATVDAEMDVEEEAESSDKAAVTFAVLADAEEGPSAVKPSNKVDFALPTRHVTWRQTTVQYDDDDEDEDEDDDDLRARRERSMSPSPPRSRFLENDDDEAEVANGEEGEKPEEKFASPAPAVADVLAKKQQHLARPRTRFADGSAPGDDDDETPMGTPTPAAIVAMRARNGGVTANAGHTPAASRGLRRNTIHTKSPRFNKDDDEEEDEETNTAASAAAEASAALHARQATPFAKRRSTEMVKEIVGMLGDLSLATPTSSNNRKGAGRRKSEAAILTNSAVFRRFGGGSVAGGAVSGKENKGAGMVNKGGLLFGAGKDGSGVVGKDEEGLQQSVRKKGSNSSMRKSLVGVRFGPGIVGAEEGVAEGEGGFGDEGEILGSSVTVLTPVRAKKKEREVLGVSSVITPVRRSLRHFPAGDDFELHPSTEVGAASVSSTSTNMTGVDGPTAAQQQARKLQHLQQSMSARKAPGKGVAGVIARDKHVRRSMVGNEIARSGEEVERLLEEVGYAYVPNKALDVTAINPLYRRRSVPAKMVFGASGTGTRFSGADDDDDEEEEAEEEEERKEGEEDGDDEETMMMEDEDATPRPGARKMGIKWV